MPKGRIFILSSCRRNRFVCLFVCFLFLFVCLILLFVFVFVCLFVFCLFFAFLLFFDVKNNGNTSILDLHYVSVTFVFHLNSRFRKENSISPKMSLTTFLHSLDELQCQGDVFKRSWSWTFSTFWAASLLG